MGFFTPRFLARTLGIFWSVAITSRTLYFLVLCTCLKLLLLANLLINKSSVKHWIIDSSYLRVPQCLRPHWWPWRRNFAARKWFSLKHFSPAKCHKTRMKLSALAMLACASLNSGLNCPRSSMPSRKITGSPSRYNYVVACSITSDILGGDEAEKTLKATLITHTSLSEE